MGEGGLVSDTWGVKATEADRGFASFYGSNFETILAATRAFTTDPDLARDSAQEAFARALHHWRRISDQPWAVGWVIKTAINHCRRQAKRRPSVEQPASVIDSGLGERLDLVAALRRLPARRRMAVVLFYIGDHSIADTAQVMGLSEGAVRAHLTLARQDLRRYLEGADD